MIKIIFSKVLKSPDIAVDNVIFMLNAFGVYFQTYRNDIAILTKKISYKYGRRVHMKEETIQTC